MKSNVLTLRDKLRHPACVILMVLALSVLMLAFGVPVDEFEHGGGSFGAGGGNASGGGFESRGTSGAVEAGTMSGDGFTMTGGFQAGVLIDCNGNTIHDLVDISSRGSDDCNANGVPDECEVYADVNHTDEVDLDDLLCLLEGLSGFPGCPTTTPGNLDLQPCGGGDGDINLYDLISMLDTLGGFPSCAGPCS